MLFRSATLSMRETCSTTELASARSEIELLTDQLNSSSLRIQDFGKAMVSTNTDLTMLEMDSSDAKLQDIIDEKQNALEKLEAAMDKLEATQEIMMQLTFENT